MTWRVAVLVVGTAAACHAQPARALAWALVNANGGGTPTLAPAYQYNSAGGTITAERLSTGFYQVYVPNMAMNFGIMQAVAYNGNHYCNVFGWGASGANQALVVKCFNPAGTVTDGDFSVLYYRENRASNRWADGYLFADQPAATAYVPTADFSWNSKGGVNTVTRTTTGRYRATFGSLLPLPNYASAMVSEAGGANARCRTDSWGASSATDITVNVACDTPAGVAVDTRFTVSLITDTAFGTNTGLDQKRGAFVWTNDQNSASYVPNLRYQYNSAGGPIRARRTGLGSYEVDIPGLVAGNSANAHVTRLGAAGYCNLAPWTAGPLNGTTIGIRCYSTSGALQDGQFSLTYLTSVLSTATLPAAGGPARAKGWLRTDAPAASGATASAYQYNSAGETNSVTRYALGSYRVDMPGLGTAAGIVHVNTLGGTAYCKANTWGPNGTTQEIYVMCFDPGGNLTDSQFTVLFYKESRTGATWNSGHARPHLPILSVTGYEPLANYTWNGRQQPANAARIGAGHYQVAFGAFTQSPNYGSVLVTPYGVTPVRCKVEEWQVDTVFVFCHEPNGSPADTEFGVSYFTDVAFGADTAANAHPGGFAWADKETTASYQPDALYRLNSTGGAIQAQRTGAGAYGMEFGGLKAANKSAALVTSYGPVSDPFFCRPDSWVASSPTPGTVVGVGCLDAAGNRVDSRYSVLYLTTPLAPAVVEASSGSPQSAQVGTQFANPLRAKVVDANIPLAGVTVNFTGPTSGAGATLSASSAVTDANGFASVTATANAIAGGYDVQASVSTVATPVTFNLTNTPIAGLGAPVFIRPTHNSTITNTIVTFEWTQVAAASRYELRVIEANTPQQFRVELLGTTATQAIYTLPSGNYRAELRACNDTGCGATGIANFVLVGGAVPSAAVLGLSCTIVNDTAQNRLNCNWNALTGAQFYFVNVVQQGTGPGGGALTVAGQQVGTNSISTLIPNGAATVLVRGCTGDGCGPFSTGVPINAAVGNPQAPILGEPFAGSSVDGGSNAPVVTFTWNRVAGDVGAHQYRLYVQDFSRNAPALDIITTNNFHAAYFNPGTRYDALVIAIPPGSGVPRQGPPSAFLTRGRVPKSPVATEPPFQGIVDRSAQGQVKVSWTPLVNNDGTVSVRRYQYFLNGPSQVGGVTNDNSVLLNLAPGAWQGVMRACTTGTSCDPASNTGWGPWNNEPGSEGGIASFTVR